MKVKLKELRSSQVSLAKLFSCDLPLKVSYKLKKLAKEVDKEIEEIEKAREDLIVKYGKKDSNGDIHVKEENIEVFNKEFSELLNEFIELNAMKVDIPITLDINLSTVDLINLESFVNIILEDEEDL